MRSSQPDRLPASPAPLIGREAEIDRALARLEEAGARLLTLTGAPGAGKTRLALALASALRDRFAHGAWFVGLEAVRDPDLVAAAIATALGVREHAGRRAAEALADYLRDRHALIVLDNFEQVTAAATVVSDLLSACPALTVLVTSRVPLRLRWEHELAVPALALPPVRHTGETATGEAASEALTPESALSYAAVRLFVERARAVQPAFRLDEGNVAAVATICARLDGLPLAIELAAARAKLYPPRAILERLAARLPFLTGGALDLPARQRTLRAAIAWSYDLLTPREQTIFRCLGVFAGGCTAAALSAVLDDPGGGPGALDGDGGVEDGLASLVNQSLLLHEEQGDGRTRFRMLATIQEYAIERLEAAGEDAAVRARAAGYVLALAEAAEPALRGPRQPEWLDRLEREHDNLRAALAWSEEGPERVELGLRLAGALLVFWWVRGHLREGRGWIERLLAGGRGSLPVRAKALMAAGFLASMQEEYTAARGYFDEAVPLLLEAGEQWHLAWTLAGQCSLPGYDEAERLALVEESLDLFRGTGDPWGTAYALYNLGLIEWGRGNEAHAAVLLQQALDLFGAAGEQRGVAMSLICLAGLAHRGGEDERARARVLEGLATARRLGDPGATAFALRQSAAIARDRGEHERAARLLAAAAAQQTGGGTPPRPPREDGADRLLASIRSALTDERFAAAWAEGWSASPEQSARAALGGREAEAGADERTADAPLATAGPEPAARRVRLTPREVEVLRLLATGRSNLEIAGALVLSVKTVERHIANIYTKIDARGRVDATAFAVRQHLI